MEFKNIAIFCGSREGHDGRYKYFAEELAQYFVNNNMTMVNGGGSVGLMGVMTEKILQSGGKCIGVISRHLKEMEVAHYGMTELITTPDMHSRKKIIHDISDAFIALPGGYGTLDELCEAITWRQLKLHDKPVGVLNVDGYFDPLIQMATKMYDEGFMNSSSKNMLVYDNTVSGLMEKMQNELIPAQSKWD